MIMTPFIRLFESFIMEKLTRRVVGQYNSLAQKCTPVCDQLITKFRYWFPYYNFVFVKGSVNHISHDWLAYSKDLITKSEHGLSRWIDAAQHFDPTYVQFLDSHHSCPGLLKSLYIFGVMCDTSKVPNRCSSIIRDFCNSRRSRGHQFDKIAPSRLHWSRSYFTPICCRTRTPIANAGYHQLYRMWPSDHPSGPGPGQGRILVVGQPHTRSSRRTRGRTWAGPCHGHKCTEVHEWEAVARMGASTTLIGEQAHQH